MADELDLSLTPTFPSNRERVAEINSWLRHLPEELRSVDVDTEMKEQVIREKIRRLQDELNHLGDLHHKKKREILDKASHNRKELSALEEAIAREALSDQYEKTAQMIREIVADFATWKMAREYQAEDVISIVHQFVIGGRGVMNANEMALGKTFESIVALYILRHMFIEENGRKPTVLWLTKSSIIKTGGTVRELTRWDPSYKLLPLDGSTDPVGRKFIVKLATNGENGLLTNYEACRTTPELKKIHWDIVIMDEVHKLKGGANPSGPTAVWKAVFDVVERSRFIMMLTGTPLVNRAEEMWSYMHIFDPEAFPSAKEWNKRFSGFKQVAGQWKMSIDSEKLFKQAMGNKMIRRTAHEVGLQLPQVIQQDIWLEHGELQGPIYESFKERFFYWLEETDQVLTTSNLMTQLLRLRQINVLPVATFKIRDEEGNIVGEEKLDVRDSSKLDAVIEMILEKNEQAVGFCSFNEPLNELAMRLQVEGKSVAIISSKYANEMDKYESEFQQGNIDVLLINNAMGEGLNLHKDPDKWSGGAGVGFTLDRWWNNSRNDQCFKRIVRPGAPGPIFFFDYYVQGSVDEYIKLVCDDKDEQFNTVTNSSHARPKEEVKEMLRKLL